MPVTLRAVRIAAWLSLVVGLCLAAPVASVQAAPCLVVTLTSTQGEPGSFNGLAGSGTLVRYGDDTNDCSVVFLQFDAGRGTSMRLAQLGLTPGRLDAIFFTHIHSDHADGFADLLQLRWHFESQRPKLDVVCSADATSPSAAISCRQFVAHIGDA
jgi:ribonuclease Z